jgi:hypothetical protein
MKDSLIGMLNFSWFDKRRGCIRLVQAERGGMGIVLRGKQIRDEMGIDPTGRSVEENFTIELAFPMAQTFRSSTS